MQQKLCGMFIFTIEGKFKRPQQNAAAF